MVVDLGGGRRKKGDAIDRRVGVVVQTKVGAFVTPEEPLCTIHAADSAAAQANTQRLCDAFLLSKETARPLPMIYGRVGPDQSVCCRSVITSSNSRVVCSAISCQW